MRNHRPLVLCGGMSFLSQWPSLLISAVFFCVFFWGEVLRFRNLDETQISTSSEAQGDWQKMLFLVDSLLKQLPHLLKGEDASIAFNIPLQACFKSRKWEHVLALLSQMCRHHVPRSVSTLGSALAACERSSQWSRALSVLQHAEHNQWPWRRIQPNVVCFNSAIAACQHVAEWSLGQWGWFE